MRRNANMLYQATHVTRYRYEEPVAQCFSEARLAPRETPYQRVVSNRIFVYPEPGVSTERLDYFGNRVTAFSVFQRHDTLTVISESTVEVAAPAAARPLMPWEAAVADVQEAGGPELLAANEFLHDSPFVTRLEALAQYGAASFTPGRPLAEVVTEISTRIHRDFKYQPKATSIDMPLADVFRLRRGVCQDFSHIMIGVLRAWRVPARYVSGYLRSGANLQGAEASHAWVSAFVPGYGWLDLDPTNNIIPGEGHVTVAWGRDYGDVTPVKGISLGGGGQTVEVEVTVRPS